MRLLHSDEISDFVFLHEIAGFGHCHETRGTSNFGASRLGAYRAPRKTALLGGATKQRYEADFRLVAHSQDDLACRLSSFQFLLRFRCFGEWKFFMDVEFQPASFDSVGYIVGAH